MCVICCSRVRTELPEPVIREDARATPTGFQRTSSFNAVLRLEDKAMLSDKLRLRAISPGTVVIFDRVSRKSVECKVVRATEEVAGLRTEEAAKAKPEVALYIIDSSHDTVTMEFYGSKHDVSEIRNILKGV